MYLSNHFRLDQIAKNDQKLTLAKQEVLFFFNESHVLALRRWLLSRYDKHFLRLSSFLHLIEGLDLKSSRQECNNIQSCTHQDQ